MNAPTSAAVINQAAARRMLAASVGFICVTEPADVPMFLRISTIAAVDRDSGRSRTAITTTLRTSSDAQLVWFVKESPDEVMAAIAAVLADPPQ